MVFYIHHKLYKVDGEDVAGVALLLPSSLVDQPLDCGHSSRCSLQRCAQVNTFVNKSGVSLELTIHRGLLANAAPASCSREQLVRKSATCSKEGSLSVMVVQGNTDFEGSHLLLEIV